MAPPPVPVLAATVLGVGAAHGVRLEGSVGAGTLEADLYRTGPSGVRAYVRGMVDVAAVGPSAIDVVDYEAPFGVAVDYVLVARNVDGETESAVVTVTVDVDDDWLVDLDDARNTGPVIVESFAELEYPSQQGVHRIIGRRTPIVTSDLRWTPTGRLVLVTLTVADGRRVRDALGSSSPLLFRSRIERGVGNMYVLPLGSVTEGRTSRIATEPSRRWTVDVVEIDRPDPSLYLPLALTWAEVVATWATWADVIAARVTWGDLLYDRTGLPDSDLYSREPAFPPRDV